MRRLDAHPLIVASRAFWVMSANICGDAWMGWRMRARRCASALSRRPAHIIGFQEFGATSLDVVGPALPHLTFVLGEIAGGIRVNPVAFDRRRFGFLESGTFWLSERGLRERGWDADEARAATWVRLRAREAGRDLLVVNTHLDHLGRVARDHGMARLLAFTNQVAEARTPTVILGDLNVSPDSEEPRWRDPEWRRPYDAAVAAGFADAWRASRSGERRPFTYHAFKGREYRGDDEGTRDPDVVFLRNLSCEACEIRGQASGPVYPSDHYFLAARCAF